MSIDSENSTTRDFEKSQEKLDIPASHSVPHNLGIEAALLGALLRNNKTYDNISEITHPDFFYNLGHQHLYKLISGLLEQGRTANEDTLIHHIDKDIILTELGRHRLYPLPCR